MSEGVVADDVAGLDDFADDFRTLLDVASDQKKSCVHVVLGEDFQQAQGVRIVGAVVVGERDLARAARQSGEGLPIPLRRSAPWTGNRRQPRLRRRRRRLGRGEHVGIVNRMAE